MHFDDAVNDLPRASVTGAERPRPQLLRRAWADLSGPWGFAFDPEDRGRAERWETRAALGEGEGERSIRVPFPPESARSGIGDAGFHRVVWYRREITAADLETAGFGTRTGGLQLHFGAVDYRAEVFLDGRLLGRHEGGHTPFSFEIGDAVRAGEAWNLVVRVEDDPHDVGQPRGKQDWQLDPHVIWYHRTTGIWQPVWLEAVPDVAVTSLHWSCDLTAATVRVEVGLNRLPADGTHLRRPAEPRGTPGRRRRVPDRPGSLLRRDPPARAGERAGLRAAALVPRVAAAARRDRRAASAAGARRRGLLLPGPAQRRRRGRAVPAERPRRLPARRARAGLLARLAPRRALGGRAGGGGAPDQGPRLQRCAAAPEVRGPAVPLLGRSTRPPGVVRDPWSVRVLPTSVGRMTREWLEVLERDRSHPSIVTWVPLNESWGVQHIAHSPAMQAYARALADLTRAIDPTRPVVSNDGWEHVDSDLITVHDYEWRPEVVRERYSGPDAGKRLLAGIGPAGRRLVVGAGQRRDAPIVLSEFGGIRFTPGATVEDAWGYSTATSEDDFRRRLTDLVAAVQAGDALAGFCYTQLTDTLQEANGLVDADRRLKLPMQELRAIITGAPRTASAPER